ncbi:MULTISPECIES: VOC family protein [Streptomyces]|uniref:VOC family protein n=1 Tax=Streptomyces cinereoruber TaxID=67260 RepID=A0AAV4KLA0_9ACTN|nr:MULTISPECIES: VOC family protein [Streptomyces]MBB4156327.1 lactoylglutathione lyase [Streptomyces cinereoruber]MBY8815824.1 VOC family protein [Streptomyces cinereoruber]NIH61600.1 lactoylglutathione lyase [Streptomyces cinereoruber]PVC70503.1 glyoxalase [Streptomyces sp. CS081A]QEV32780.1 VOC family protein [Streptomyces cinereoruber]
MSAIGTLTTHHVGINVTDLERSLAFYADVLGFEVIGRGAKEESGYAFLGRDGRLVIALWQQAEGVYDSGRPGLHHLAFEAESIEHVRAAEAALTARGTTFAYEGVVAHQEGAAAGGIFFHDPDGTRLEISVPKGAEAAPAPSGTAPACGFF